MAFTLDSDQKAIRDRIDFCVVALPVFDPHLGISIRDAVLDERLAELTTYFTVFSFTVPRTEIAWARSVDAALAAGTKDYCLIQNAGHLFFGHTDLARDLHAAMEACEFLTGRIHDRGGYFYLDDQCLLINRRAWERLGRPVFGVPQASTQTVSVPVYAPHGGRLGDLAPSSLGELSITARFGYGWRAISASLTARHNVRQWPETLQPWHLACAAYREDIGAWREALLDNVVAPRPTAPAGLRAYLDVLCTRFMANADHPPVFVFNSEADFDLPVLSVRPGLDTAFVLAAGFKSNRILETIGYHENTDVVFYDYSAAALALKRLTVEEWDGADFGAFFTAVRPRLEAMFSRQLYYMQPDALATNGTLNHEFQAEMRSVFPSREHWLAHWQKFRRLHHRYVQVDLIAAPDTARGMIHENARGDTALWVSDMFNAPYAVGKFSWARRQSAFDTLTDALAKATDSYVMLGGAPALWQAWSA